MKLVVLEGPRIGVLRDGVPVDVTAAFADIPYRTAADWMPRVIAALPERRAQAEALAASGAPVADARLLAPIPRPPKLIACFANYREGRSGERLAQDMFLESPDSVIGPGGTVRLPNHPTDVVHHEAELALVIGSRVKDLPADERAFAALAGYTAGIDVSARGIGRMGPSRIGKSFDTFTPLGPCIVTPDEISDPHNLQLTLTVNGVVATDFNTNDMEYNIPEILAYATSYMTLVPGDVILTGTNHIGMGPIQHGDVVELTIEQIGVLRVNVEDPLGRAWPRPSAA
ncbi:MAG: fumarylacetoacetate hydrolase [Chloroflexi bacterium]|nr:MAG: fumarylacetoacetate hydrolase [Chloroflexota bacterium]